MTDRQVTVDAEQREILLAELDGILETTAALYRQIGRDWDPHDGSAPTRDVALVVRAHDQLDGAAPWHLEGTEEELVFLLGRLRDGAELALQRGTQPSPGDREVAMGRADPAGTDLHLDVLSVCDALLARVPGDA